MRTENDYLEMVRENGLALYDVPKAEHTEALCEAAVQQNGKVLEYVPMKLRNEAVCLAAVKQYGCALRFVPERQRTVEICTAAVQQDSWAFEYVPKKLWYQVNQAIETVKEKDRTIFAERIRSVRVSRNLTQRELGKKIGLSQQAIPQIETGSSKPSIDTLLKLSKALEVSADYLLGLTDEASPYKTGGAA